MNLEEIGLVQLSTTEVQETEGGFWKYVLGYLIDALVGSPRDFADGVTDGANAHP